MLARYLSSIIVTPTPDSIFRIVAMPGSRSFLRQEPLKELVD